MTPEFSQIASWLKTDAERLRLLRVLADLHLPDAWLAAGFVRNLVWDRLHGHAESTPLADLDVIYFDATDCRPGRDREIEALLAARAPGWPWSVRNQAAMHLRNDDAPYGDSLDAMRFWVEVESALAARLTAEGELEVVSPFAQEGLFALHLTPNPWRPRPEAFRQRLATKGWLERWPRLRIQTA
ncbi:nitrate reductase [Pseudomonas oryzihabitans]|uniref:nucleotidyltransferase family protein n=1 Tax=Pseudomonas oryzihabitans TaxID=47885 RepID=UPI0005CB550A|nr:nucleotidyltransferase family protein [Pseudomonas oryzihabitans]KIZ52315.1 nitrate reductase [Pseudomonas oryzihabitans]